MKNEKTMWTERLINISVGLFVIGGILWAGGSKESAIQKDIKSIQDNVNDIKTEVVAQRFLVPKLAELQASMRVHCEAQKDSAATQFHRDDAQDKSVEMLNDGILLIMKMLAAIEVKMEIILNDGLSK